VGAQYLVGVTGHQNLSPSSRHPISEAIKVHLRTCPSAVVGVTSLAGGADQIFADSVLSIGGRIMVVLPCKDYEASFHSADDLNHFKRLLASAESVVRMPFDAPSESAYLAAGKEVAARVNQLLAVWDGQSAKGLGGTADIVSYARQLGKAVAIIWPEGASRISKDE
jgi:hypothetical protein